MAEPNYPIPNLPALRAQLSPGLGLELVDGISDAQSMAEVSTIFAHRLRMRVAAIEEALGATPEVG